MEAAALAESWSKHPISLSIKAAYGRAVSYTHLDVYKRQVLWKKGRIQVVDKEQK